MTLTATTNTTTPGSAVGGSTTLLSAQQQQQQQLLLQQSNVVSGFGGSSNNGGPATDRYTMDDFLPLNEANASIIACLRADEDSPNADLYRRIGSVGSGNPAMTMTAANGASPYFLTGNNNNGASSSSTTVSHSHSIPLSPFLANELANTKLSSLMGLLPEANLAWMSVDEKIYLWNYTTSNTNNTHDNATTDDFVSFTVPYGQCIVSVGLVKPKPGVFKEIVDWCLIITTAEEVILCALARESTTTNFNIGTASNNQYNSCLRLIPTRYVIPTDSVPIVSVCGTNDGRIFLGGYDGNLYEMSYEGLTPTTTTTTTTSNASNNGYWYDENENQEGVSTKMLNNLVAGSKRAVSSILFGNSSERPHKKCRKINHTGGASSLVSALVPGFVLQMASAVLLTSSASASIAGPIIQLAIDPDRHAIYALTSKGFIHSFELGPTTGINTNSNMSAPRLVHSIDVSKSARRYLESIIRGSGRTYSSSSSSSAYVSSISYTGGTVAAQNGVGGMDGARDILKIADQQHTTKDTRNNKNVLCPVSIHIIPPSESKSFTLLATTGAGLRYYMSALPSSPTSSNSYYQRRPQFHLCHIRALPPFQTTPVGDLTIDYNNIIMTNKHTIMSPTTPTPMTDLTNRTNYNNSNNPQFPEGIHPRIPTRDNNVHNSNQLNWMVKKCFYQDGLTVMAVDSTNNSSTSANSITGNSIIALAPDHTDEKSVIPSYDHNSYSNNSMNLHSGAATGVSETLSLPMAQNGASSLINLGNTDTNSQGSSSTTRLPGGAVWDMAKVGSSQNNSILNLKIHSTTPSDAELDNIGFIPAYFPPSRNIRQRNILDNEQQLSRITNNNHLVVGNSALSVASNSVPTTTMVTSNNNNNNNKNNRGMITFTINLLSRFLFNSHNMPGKHYYPSLSQSGGIGRMPSYKISNRYGCGISGFSSLAGGTGGKISVTRTNNNRNSSTTTRRSSSSKGRRISSNSRRGRGGMSRSARLSPWLLSPPAVPLSEFAMTPLPGLESSGRVLVLNSGGFHVFRVSSTLDQVSMILSKSNTNNLAADPMVKSQIFTKYGFEEGCAMCLSLAICGKNETIQRKAVQAALTFAHRPALVPSYHNRMIANGTSTPSTTDDIQGDDKQQLVTSTIPVPPGYTFQSSFLYDGLVALLSRLLRPIWFKPAVVVIESRRRMLPATVELLLDDDALEEIRRPLSAMQKLLKDVFAPAVGNVPGVPSSMGTHDQMMDIDDFHGNNNNNGHDLISRALQYQSRNTPSTTHKNHTEKDLNQLARLMEDRNIHSAYRLVSRTVQLLTLLSHLRRAHSIPELPEVEWGLLHGLTYCQLVTTRLGHDRIETILTNLVSSNESNHVTSATDFILTGPTSSSSSVEANNLSTLFATQCYHFFSAGSRLTNLGFQTASSALSFPLLSEQRKHLSNKAASYFRTAARNWINPSLITGRLLPMENYPLTNNYNTSSAMNQDSWYADAAIRAYDYGSPLARASSILMELGNVGAIVDICLICAGNFGGRFVAGFDDSLDTVEENNNGGSNTKMAWEKDLYHRPATVMSKDKEKASSFSNQFGITTSSSNSNKSTPSAGRIVSGIEVTGEDAKRTCYAVLLHHLFFLLDSSSTVSGYREAAEEMVAVAAASNDVQFLNMFFKNILDTGYVDTLLRIDSPDLESWLSDTERQPVLLWRHYIIHGLDWKAGEVMWQRARSPATEKISLNERLECLTRAVNSYTAALEKDSSLKNSIGKPSIPVTAATFQMTVMPQKKQGPSSDELNRIIAQISEEIDVATIQHRILSIIESSKSVTPIDAEKLDTISSSLLNVTDLYNDYAASLALYDVCLFILNTCRHNEASTITTLWKSIICEELLPCKTDNSQVKEFLDNLKRGSLLEEENIILVGEDTTANNNVYNSVMIFENGEWISRLKNRILSLGKELYGKGADFTFPLDFIIDTLDGLHQMYFLSSGALGLKIDLSQISWPLRTLIDAGVQFPMLLESYQTLFEIKQKESAGSRSARIYVYYVSNICCVLGQWVSSAKSDMTKGKNGTPSSSVVQLARSSNRILSQIDTYKSLLESVVGVNNENVSNVCAKFSELENFIKTLS